MPLVSVKFPGGYYRNGDQYASKQRWRYGSLVRFVDGRPRAIGGWERRTNASAVNIAALVADPTTATPRNIFAWRDNSGGRWFVVGTTLALKAVASSGAVTDITPSSGFTAGAKDAVISVGFGTGNFGDSTFGTPRNSAGVIAIPVGNWRFDAWGQDLLAAGPLGANTKLFAHTPGGGVAATVTNAPTDFNDFLVTDERIVMCFGTGDNKRGVSWSDREARTVWTPAITNQAGSYTLPGVGQIIAGRKVNGNILIVTENEAFVGRYLGPPFIYGFDQISGDCGCLNSNSVIATADFAIWPTNRGFFMFDGAGVKPVPCDVQDFLLSDMNMDAVSKMQGHVNRDFTEVWWLYQSGISETGDVDHYVALNYRTGEWTTGEMDRSCALDRGVLSTVVMVTPTGLLYNHELVGNTTDDHKPFVISGPMELGEGDQMLHIDSFISAEGQTGNVEVLFHAKDGPHATLRTYGPYTVKTQAPSPVRVRGRQISMEIRAKDFGTNWLAGNFRINVIPSGGR